MWVKILSALVLVIPHIILSIFVWFLLPFDTDIRILAVVSAFSVVLLSFSNGFLGTIVPNFSQGHDPEKVSTSTMGIVALIVSIIITGVVGYIIYQFLSGIWSSHGTIIVILEIGLLVILSLSLFSQYFSRRYEFK